MRTTVTIDDSLMAELQQAAVERGESLEAVIDRALRVGVEALDEPDEIAPFVAVTFNMGQPRGDFTKALQLAAELETEEIVRAPRNVGDHR